MRYVSATEAKQGFAEVLESAQRGPVTIRRQKRDVAVLLSMAEYGKLTRLNIDAFQRHADLIGRRAAERGLTDDRLADLLQAGRTAADRRRCQGGDPPAAPATVPARPGDAAV